MSLDPRLLVEILFSVVSTLITTLVGFYVKATNESMQGLARRSEEHSLSIAQLQIKVAVLESKTSDMRAAS